MTIPYEKFVEKLNLLTQQASDRSNKVNTIIARFEKDPSILNLDRIESDLHFIAVCILRKKEKQGLFKTFKTRTKEKGVLSIRDDDEEPEVKLRGYRMHHWWNISFLKRSGVLNDVAGIIGDDFRNAVIEIQKIIEQYEKEVSDRFYHPEQEEEATRLRKRLYARRRRQSKNITIYRKKLNFKIHIKDPIDDKYFKVINIERVATTITREDHQYYAEPPKLSIETNFYFSNSQGELHEAPQNSIFVILNDKAYRELLRGAGEVEKYGRVLLKKKKGVLRKIRKTLENKHLMQYLTLKSI